MGKDMEAQDSTASHCSRYTRSRAVPLTLALLVIISAHLGSVEWVSAQTPDTIISASSTLGAPGETGLPVDVRTSNPIVVGSTDLRLTFDPNVVEAMDVTSPLTDFVFFIDPLGTVTTASATANGQACPGGEALFTATFNVLPGAEPGCAVLGIEDADGLPPDDLIGPIPPIDPLPQILYESAPGQICISTCGNGQLDGPEICDDGNTIDGDCCSSTCEQIASDGTGCNDGNACTTNDSCSGGACAGGPPPNCDDSDICTDDSCAPATGCVNTNNTAPCDDGNACTTNDTCSGGACAGGPPPNCDDSDVCTDDSCAPATGCVNTNNTAPCDDGNACTTNDTCSGGACAGGPPLNCDDSDICTDDSCVPVTGCVHTNNTASCDDGNVCTTEDSCLDGACSGSLPPCDALGDVDCDGNPATPVDAQVILCLDVQRCVDADVPPPCDQPTERAARSDWDLDGDVDSADAMTTIRAFIGITDPADTPLGSCCLATGEVAAR
jgi:cysteine-rich repeat protein